MKLEVWIRIPLCGFESPRPKHKRKQGWQFGFESLPSGFESLRPNHNQKWSLPVGFKSLLKDSNHLRKIEDKIESEKMDSNPFSTDSNLLRKIEDKTENKEMDLNPSYMDSNHSASFKVRSQGELHGFESPHIGFESSTGKSCKRFESLKFRFESARQKIKSDSFPTASFWSITGLFLLQRAKLIERVQILQECK